MKTMLLILFLILPAPARDGNPRAVEPIRVTVTAPGDEANAEMARAVRDELRKYRDIVVTDSRADFAIRTCAVRVVSRYCAGYSVAVVVEDVHTRRASLDAYTGGNPREVAAFIVTAMDRERFALRRAASLSKKRN